MNWYKLRNACTVLAIVSAFVAVPLGAFGVVMLAFNKAMALALLSIFVCLACLGFVSVALDWMFDGLDRKYGTRKQGV